MKNIALLLFFILPSCQNPAGNPLLANSPYPSSLHLADSVPIQVIRDDDIIAIVNSTADDYPTTTIWVNQRFSSPLPSMPAGSTIEFNLVKLRDAYGEQFNAGGIWRTDEATDLIIVELQIDEETPLVGLIVINED